MPINPVPDPTTQERVVATARRHYGVIETTTLGIALGVLVALVSTPLLGALVVVAYAAGALIESRVSR